MGPGESRPPEQTLLNALANLAAVDAAFRRALLRDPHAAIREAFGLELPPAIRVRFMERPPEVDFLMVLPDFVGEGSELDDAELEGGSGGSGGWSRSGSSAGWSLLSC